MKYVKLILIIILGFTLTFGSVSASIFKVNPIQGESSPIFIFSALNNIVAWGQSIFNRIFHPQFGTISHIETTDTIGTLRTTVNTVIDSIQNTTSSLGAFASLASTTGNLIVGSSTQWRAMIVGSNGKILTASSTAVGGISWETSGTGITSLNGSTSSSQTFSAGTGMSISTANGAHTFTNIAVQTLTGSTYVSVSSATGTPTISLNITPVSSTRAISTGSGLLGGGDLSADRTLYWNANVATATIATATTTNLSVTSTLTFTADGTKQTTAYKTLGFNVLNATTSATATTTIQRLIYQNITLTQLDCFTNGANATITVEDRASSTPDTAGTVVATSMVCDSNGFSTSTFSSANIAALRLINFNITSLANSTTTLRVAVKYKEQ